MKLNRLKYLILFTSLSFTTLYAEGLLYKNRDMVLKMLVETTILLKEVDDIYKKDRELILKIVDANNYDDIDESLKSDKEILRKAIEAGYDLRKADENMSSDRALVLSSIKNNANNFKYAKDVFKKDKDFVFEVVENYYPNLKYADERLKKDKEFILKIIKIYPDDFNYMDESLKSDRDIYMVSMKKGGYGLEFADANITDNIAFVAEVIQKNPFAYKFISPRLKKDKELLLLAFRSVEECDNYEILKYADDALKSDREFVKKVLELNVEQYKFISPELKKDKEIAWMVITDESISIDMFNKFLLEDNDFVLSIIKETGIGLKYATKEQRSNKALVIKALNLNEWAFSEADDSLKRDRAFILDEVAKVGTIDFVESIDSSLLKDRNFVYELFKRGYPVEESPFNSDKAFILKLIDDTNGSISLTYIDKNLYRDESFMLTAIKKAGQGLEYATKEQQRDKKLILEAVKNGLEDWDSIDTSLWKDEDFVLKVVGSKNEGVWKYIDDSLKNSKDFILKLLATDGWYYEYLEEKDKENIEYALVAISQNINVVEILSENLIKDNEEIKERIDEIKHPLWKKIFNPLTILLFGLFSYWFLGRKKV